LKTSLHCSLWMNDTPLGIHTMFSLSIHLLIAIVHSAALNMAVQVSLLFGNLHSFRYMTRSGIAGSCGSSVFSFQEFH
jgi:hypothetical protein